MAILVKGTDFSTGDQVTALNLDNLVDAATFASGAVDGSTTQLSGGAIIVKDGGITSAKLDTNIAINGTLSAAGAVSFPVVTAIGSATPGTVAATSLSATGNIAQTRSATDAEFRQTSSGGSGTDWYLTSRTNGTWTLSSATNANVYRVSDTTHTFYSSNSQVAQISAAGLAVTGALSATGALTLGTDLAVTEGGTGASTADNARTNLGVAIGTDVQAYNANLTTYAGIAPSANVQTLLGAANYSAFRTSLGVAIGTDVQAYNANLTTYAGIAPAANVQTFLGAADYSAMRTQLGLVIGTNVQAWDADLDALAALSGTDTIYYRSGAATWSAVTIGSNLSFSGGSLSATASGGSVTDVSVVTANGVSGSVATSTSTPAITLTLGAITPTSVTASSFVQGSEFRVSGTKVVGAQAAAESDLAMSTSLSGGDTVSAATIASNFGTLNGKFNSLLGKLRTHGLLAT